MIEASWAAVAVYPRSKVTPAPMPHRQAPDSCVRAEAQQKEGAPSDSCGGDGLPERAENGARDEPRPPP